MDQSYGWRKEDDAIEKITFKELLSDLGETTLKYHDVEVDDRRETASPGEDDDLDWISELDDDNESDDRIQTVQLIKEINDPSREGTIKKLTKFNASQKLGNDAFGRLATAEDHDDERDDETQTGKRARELDDKPSKVRKKRWRKFIWSEKDGGSGEFAGYAKSSQTILMSGSTSGIDWRVKRSDHTTDRRVDVILRPDREPRIDEVVLVIEKVVTSLFEKKYIDEIDQNCVKICLAPQGLDPITLWIGDPKSFVLADFMTTVGIELEGDNKISYHFGITVRLSRADENDRITSENVTTFVTSKQDIITPSSQNVDGLDLARSIMLIMYHPSYENHPQYTEMKKRGRRPSPLLDQFCQEFHEKAGVPVKKRFTYSEFDTFQKTLPDRYRLVILGDPWSRKILYAGPPAESNIYVFNYEDRYYVVRKPEKFYSLPYFCEKCLKGHKNRDHICKQEFL
ncbi:hypothetical protein HOLleu_37762 [Holothuria leucospilota]|uniref:Uncharacterized protein n=1 Tax=Holothuria leucospilota TaxID=206669 RepID=A0A9Q1BER7_HOLLE|nr:hypothetical protein HOLleu_37762 [Holothuria leucospilota]